MSCGAFPWFGRKNYSQQKLPLFHAHLLTYQSGKTLLRLSGAWGGEAVLLIEERVPDGGMGYTNPPLGTLIHKAEPSKTVRLFRNSLLVLFYISFLSLKNTYISFLAASFNLVQFHFLDNTSQVYSMRSWELFLVSGLMACSSL